MQPMRIASGPPLRIGNSNQFGCVKEDSGEAATVG